MILIEQFRAAGTRRKINIPGSIVSQFRVKRSQLEKTSGYKREREREKEGKRIITRASAKNGSRYPVTAADERRVHERRTIKRAAMAREVFN